MVLDLTCLATRNANRRSRSSASVGARFVTVLSFKSSATALSRLCTRRPPATVFAVSPAARGLRVERAIDRDDSAVGGRRIAGERLSVGADEIGAFGYAAGVGVLDD